MTDCDHLGSRIYARRTLPDGSVHVCVQCIRCFLAVKRPEHNFRLYLRLSEVPAGVRIYDFIDKADAK